jgi:hypothetical protein
MRPVCPACNQRPVAVNYHFEGTVRYRKLCDTCIRKGKRLKPIPPAWVRAGYRKKDRCDHCGWRAKYPEKQMSVFYVDGNLKNNNNLNLRTVCLNCRVEIAHSKLPWRESDVKPDF